MDLIAPIKWSMLFFVLYLTPKSSTTSAKEMGHSWYYDPSLFVEMLADPYKGRIPLPSVPNY